MINYTTLASNLKRGIFNFSQKISQGLTRPEMKFVAQMSYGLLAAQNTHISAISRTLNENITLKKTIDRLSTNLANFSNGKCLFYNYLQAVKPQIKNTSILIIDGSDIAKPCSPKMQDICGIYDAGKKKTAQGYYTIGAAALSAENKMPIPVYTRVYSTKETDFVSQDNETLKCLQFLSQHFKKSNVRALDRGYDNRRYFEYFLQNSELFIVKMTQNRNVLYNGKSINILELSNKRKGKLSLKFQKKNGVLVDCKISMVPVKLPFAPDKELNLVVCYGFGEKPMMLLTNLTSTDKRLPVAVAKVCLMRWRIEEFYRFKKQQFNFEGLRVRSLKSIRNLDLLLTIAIGYLAKTSENWREVRMHYEVVCAAKRIYGVAKFVFYALADGIKWVLQKSQVGIANYLKKHPKSSQLCFFPCDCWHCS